MSSNERVVLVGAGVACATYLSVQFQELSKSAFEYVGIVDDSELLRGSSVRGVPVLGAVADLPALVRSHAVSLVVVAISNFDQGLIDRIQSLLSSMQVGLSRIPTFEELVYGANISELREVVIRRVTRSEISQSDQIASFWRSNSPVLVSGAGGSIGSELVRQLVMCGVSSLICLDRDESTLTSAVSRANPSDTGVTKIHLADIRDTQALISTFSEHQPRGVIHTAALKHLPILEKFPLEAWKTNVMGTVNMLKQSSENGVSTFINISTDKAANPSSVLGYSKLITERLVADMSKISSSGSTKWISTRFGNVTKSRGSVFEVFQSQAVRGAPLTVSDPDVRRYFISIEDAARFALMTPLFADSADTVIPNMGQEVYIREIAERMAKSHSPELSIVYTGLKPGEKLREELICAADGPSHSYVDYGATAVKPKPLAISKLSEINVDDSSVLGWLRILALGSET